MIYLSTTFLTPLSKGGLVIPGFIDTFEIVPIHQEA